ncbi:hypothetical protein ACLOJK_020049 [Asimina triloba]
MYSCGSNGRRSSLRVLKSCKSLKQVKQVHAQILTAGLSHDSTFAFSSKLLAFCASHPGRSSIAYARLLFYRLHRPTLCILNTMIKALLFHGHFASAVEIYVGMLRDGQLPDHYTLPYILKACAAALGARGTGEQIHVHALKLGFAGFDVFVSNSLIKMYLGCGGDDVEKAKKVFDDMVCRNEASWTVMISGYAKLGEVETARLLFDEAPVKDTGVWGAMISGYVQNNCLKEGLRMFQLLQLENMAGDEGVLVSVLSACAQLGALDLGIWVHEYLGRIGLVLGVRLGTALIDMYIKCGSLNVAKNIFDEILEKDVVCWNVMILGMAMHGDGQSALRLLSEMKEDGLAPDDVTFIALFMACSHSGMVHTGLQEFSRMKSMYGVEPKGEHYGCVVDFLGRAGLFAEAMKIIQQMPVSISASDQAIAWRALLSACWQHGEARMAEVAAETLFHLERHNGVYVLLSNIYASSGKFIDAINIRKIMKDRGLEKTPGCSLIEVNGSVHEFIAGEKIHHNIDEIYNLLEKIAEHLEAL